MIEPEGGRAASAEEERRWCRAWRLVVSGSCRWCRGVGGAGVAPVSVVSGECGGERVAVQGRRGSRLGPCRVTTHRRPRRVENDDEACSPRRVVDDVPRAVGSGVLRSGQKRIGWRESRRAAPQKRLAALGGGTGLVWMCS